MIEQGTAQELVSRLTEVEERLGRLLVSGWRQAGAEASELRQAADELAEAGLDGIAARVMAVAQAQSAEAALPAIALASSACRLMRARLPGAPMPADWTPLVPPKRRAASGTDTLLPISCLLLDGREVWACLWVARNRCILLEPPFPAEEAPAEPEQAPQGGGVFGKLKRRIGLIAEDAVPTASRWLNERLRGTLVWQARHPLGAEADLACCTLDRAEWVAEADEQKTLSPFRQKLAANALEDGLTMSWTAGGLRVVALNRADSAAYCWLDPSGPALLAASLDTTVWSVAWTDGSAVLPLAFLAPGWGGRAPRLVHLLPGSPSDVLSTAV
ncbi:MAG: hypothetical protein U0893_12955 [Chloroflexota bacterium]